MINSIIKVLNGSAGLVDFGYFALAILLLYLLVKLIIYCLKK